MLANMIYKQRPKEMWIFNLEKRKSNRADGSSNMKRHHRGAVLAACRGWGMGDSRKGSSLQTGGEFYEGVSAASGAGRLGNPGH